ncbi:MAG: filamentous hemagglutinin N-terminal domain-containing protein [Janthinobacterium lividum]
MSPSSLSSPLPSSLPPTPPRWRFHPGSRAGLARARAKSLPAWRLRNGRTGGRTVCAVAAWLICSAAQAITPLALPQGEHIVQGDISIVRDGADMRIVQNGAQGIVDWRSFDIGRDAMVHVRQSSSQATLLNRVVGATTSDIAGSLEANGRLYLVNPNGITISSGGSISAAAFVASTLDLANGDFLAGLPRFTASAPLAACAIGHAGRIMVEDGGFVALLGHRIAQSGAILAPQGRVGLGAGASAMLTPHGRTLLSMRPAVGRAGGGEAAIVMSGIIEADGGLVQMSAPFGAVTGAAPGEAVNLGGVVRAHALAGRPGSISVTGDGGIVRLSGVLNASGNAPGSGYLAGGAVQVNGRQVLMDGGEIDVSGAMGGGSVQLAARAADGAGSAPAPGAGARDLLLFVGATSRLNANATWHGPGGDVKLASDGKAVFLGSAQARGAALAAGPASAAASGSTPSASASASAASR